jgi:hypothetical protein
LVTFSLFGVIPIISVSAEEDAMHWRAKVLNFASLIVVLVEFEGKLECVPAGDGTHFCYTVGIFHFPDIPGIEKMLPDLVRVFPHISLL